MKNTRFARFLQTASQPIIWNEAIFCHERIEIADEKGVSLSQLALAWSLAKYDHVQSLIGTTSPEHLQDAINALKIELSAEDITRIETALDADKVGGKGMRNFVFTDGVISLAK